MPANRKTEWVDCNLSFHDLESDCEILLTVKRAEMKRKETKETSPKKAKKSATTSISIKSGPDVIDSIFSAKKKKEETPKAKEITRKTKQSGSEMPKQKGDKSILENVFSKSGTDWVDDGLGGRFNNEGYTGRVEDGVKVFKAHVLNRPTAGTTKECPFDCNCCFI